MRAQVLLLDAEMTIIRMVSVRRAIKYVLNNKGSVALPAPNAPFVHEGILVPSVVILNHVPKIEVSKRERPVRWSKRGVLIRDNYECAYCTERRADTVDHILPSSLGGGSTWLNTIAACRPCNGEKSDRTPEEWGVPLRFEPMVPESLPREKQAPLSLTPEQSDFLTQIAA